MSKIGVGIGEDFPADDSKPAEAPAGRGDRRCGYCASDTDHAARREAYRKWREQRREWRRQWKKARNEKPNERRADWRAWSRTFQRELHDNIVRNIRHGISERSRNHNEHSPKQPEWNQPLLWAILALIAIIALVSFVMANIFVIAGTVALLALFAAYYRGHDPFALEPDAGAPREATAQ